MERPKKDLTFFEFSLLNDWTLRSLRALRLKIFIILHFELKFSLFLFFCPNVFSDPGDDVFRRGSWSKDGQDALPF
jgi:hypothetical protein